MLKDSKIGEFNKIVFTGKDGASMGTQPYFIRKLKAKRFPTEMMDTRDGRRVKMRVIPLDEIALLELDDPCYHVL